MIVIKNYAILSVVNECLINNGGCEQICTSVDGSHQCSCTPGYMLEADNLNCEGSKRAGV